jgi:hypothetical protein
MRKRFLLLLLLPLLGYSAKVPFHQYLAQHPDFPEIEAPWFTGPLLAPASFTVPAGHWNFEPYIYAIANTGLYDKHWEPKKRKTYWNNIFQPDIQVGVTSWMDVEIAPTLYYNYRHGAGKWVFADMPIIIDFQLYKQGVNVLDWIMGLKLVLKETIPCGKYQNLNPKKLGTDVGGQGSWQTALGLVWGNLFHLGGNHFLTWRTSLQYTLPAPVHVKNLNAYGGGAGTHGTVYPAQNFQIDTAFELSITKHWVFAIDFVGNWFGAVRFKGTTPFPMTPPAGIQYSIAPAIEYNWNANLGLIFGSWFTVAGRNAAQFTSGIFAVNYYY